MPEGPDMVPGVAVVGCENVKRRPPSASYFRTLLSDASATYVEPSAPVATTLGDVMLGSTETRAAKNAAVRVVPDLGSE